jgi:hypothetical protein
VFIALRVRTATVVHGYTPDNVEIVERVADEPFVDKLVAVDRLRSATEKYLLVTSSHGRVMYWEYEGGLERLTRRLQAAGLVVPQDGPPA